MFNFWYRYSSNTTFSVRLQIYDYVILRVGEHVNVGTILSVNLSVKKY